MRDTEWSCSQSWIEASICTWDTEFTDRHMSVSSVGRIYSGHLFMSALSVWKSKEVWSPRYTTVICLLSLRGTRLVYIPGKPSHLALWCCANRSVGVWCTSIADLVVTVSNASLHLYVKMHILSSGNI